VFGLVYYGVFWGYFGLWVLGGRSPLVDVLRAVGRAFVWPGVVGVAWAISLPLLYGLFERVSSGVASFYVMFSVIAGTCVWVWAVALSTRALSQLGGLNSNGTAGLVGWLFLPAVIGVAVALFTGNLP
jgi:hypothetical protein